MSVFFLDRRVPIDCALHGRVACVHTEADSKVGILVTSVKCCVVVQKCFQRLVCMRSSSWVLLRLQSRAALPTDIMFYRLIPKTSPGFFASFDVLTKPNKVHSFTCIVLHCRNFDGRSFRYRFTPAKAASCNSDIVKIENAVKFEDCLKECYSGECQQVIFETKTTKAKVGTCKMCPVFQEGQQGAWRLDDKSNEINPPMTL